MMFISKSLNSRPLMLLLMSLGVVLLTTAPLPVRGAGQKSGADAEGGAPVFSAYRGVQLGMTADEVRRKLGHLKDKSDEQDFFVFSDNETAQILYDSDKKVKTVSVDFLSGAADVPLAKTVVGADVEAKADGSVYRLVRYPKAGFWVSYSKTAGDSPLISVTIQKIQ